MINTKDAGMAEFEAWATHPDRGGKLPIEKHLNGAYRDTRTYTAWYGWQAARAGSIDSQLDSNTLKKMAFLSESKKSMRPVGVVLIDDDTGQRATIDMGRVTWAGANQEPVIDGYPLWSGLPLPIETADLIARLQASIGDAECYEWKSVSVANIRAAIGLLSAQPVERVALSDSEIKQIVIDIASEMYGEDDGEYTSGDAEFYGAFARGVIEVVKRDDVASMNGEMNVLIDLLRDVLMPLSVSKMDAMTSGEEDDYRMIRDLEIRIKAAIAASTKESK